MSSVCSLTFIRKVSPLRLVLKQRHKRGLLHYLKATSALREGYDKHPILFVWESLPAWARSSGHFNQAFYTVKQSACLQAISLLACITDGNLHASNQR